MSINKHMATLVSELIRSEKVIDKNAETIAEIMARCKTAQTSTQKQIRDLVKAGKVEQVWKTVNGRTSKAYRIKRHEKETIAKNSRRR